MKKLAVVLLVLLIACAAYADTYVVCVGVGNYADPKVQKLAKTEGDAKAMAEFYKQGTPNVITITGKYATRAQILKSIRSQYAKARKGDKIVFYFSGHGYPGGFCPYDMRSIDQGLTYNDVLSVMQDSKASSKFIFADACNSGAIRHGGKAAKPRPGNVMMFLSSRGSESSLESSFAANGFFTKALLRGLRGAADTNSDRKITAREIFNYVSDAVKTDTRGQQHPVMWGKFDDNLTIVEYRKK